MGGGYLFGTVGPLLGGWLKPATGNRTLPLLVYALIGGPMLQGAWMMSKPGRYLEDRFEPAVR